MVFAIASKIASHRFAKGARSTCVTVKNFQKTNSFISILTVPEGVGCFSLPHSKSPLQKVPESPKIINAKFYLFKRDINFTTPELITFSNGQAFINGTKFDAKLPVKMIIHGYMSKWNEKGNLLMANAYLKLVSACFRLRSLDFLATIREITEMFKSNSLILF